MADPHTRVERALARMSADEAAEAAWAEQLEAELDEPGSLTVDDLRRRLFPKDTSR